METFTFSIDDFIKDIDSILSYNTENVKLTVTTGARKYFDMLLNDTTLGESFRKAYKEVLEEAAWDAHNIGILRICITSSPHPRGINLERDAVEDYTWFKVYNNGEKDVWVLRNPKEVCVDQFR